MDIFTDNINGSLVSIEVLTESHADEFVTAASDPEIWKFMPFDMSNAEMARLFVQHVATQPNTGDSVGFLVRENASNQIVGGSGYWHIDHQHNTLEIGGSWVKPSHQRTGVNTEVKFLLLRNAFERMQCQRVGFSIDERNSKSLAAIERIGAVREGVARSDTAMHDGGRRNSVQYSIILSEWPSVKKRLEEFSAKYA